MVSIMTADLGIADVFLTKAIELADNGRFMLLAKQFNLSKERLGLSSIATLLLACVLCIR